MAKFALVFVCLIVIEASVALKCKLCKNPNDRTCKDVEDETCPTSSANVDVLCLYHLYKTSKDSKEEILERKCVTTAKDTTYQCVKANSNEVEIVCKTCKEEFCNLNGASRFSLGSVGFVAVLAILVQKFL